MKIEIHCYFCCTPLRLLLEKKKIIDILELKKCPFCKKKINTHVILFE